MISAEFFNTTVEIKQDTQTKTPQGGIKHTFSTRIPALACRLMRKVIREADEFGKMTVRTNWRLYCPAGATERAIAATDRVVRSDGTVYQVKEINNVDELNEHLQIDCLELS